MKIDVRFAVILGLSLLGGLAIAAYVSFSLAARQARDDLALSASLLLETAQAVRGYTSEEIAPLMPDLAESSDFHPQSVPSYGAQSTIRRLDKAFPEYSYREASMNPTNPGDRATDQEAGLLLAFRDRPELKELSGEVGDGKEVHFYLARPIRVDAPACLDCHGSADHAPKALLARYGSNGGFGYRLGDVIGIQRVLVSVKPWRDKAIAQVWLTLVSVGCIAVLSLATFMLLLRKYFIRPLNRITRFAEATSLGEAPDPHVAGGSLGGQFSDLREAIERLKTSVERAAAMLEKRSRETFRG